MFDPVLVTPSIPSSSFLPYLSLLGVPDFRQHLADGHGHFPVPQGPAGREETPAVPALLREGRGARRGSGVQLPPLPQLAHRRPTHPAAGPFSKLMSIPDY